jgi:hypothetical protein
VVFIIGHGRSGTTNLHKGLASLEGVATGYFFDFLMPSLILKHISYPLVGLLNYFYFKTLLNADGTPNHKLGPWEELEDHMYCLNLHQTNILAFFAYPSLGLSELRQLTKFDERHLNFVKKCIARSLYF